MHLNSPLHASHLNNLADLLKNEVQARRQPHTRLVEARELAERALAIVEKIGDLSLEPWKDYSLAAQIADMEGRSEEASTFRRRERETFVQFAGNRWHIDKQFGELITAIAAGALGNEQARAAVEPVFAQMEAGDWGKVPPVIRRIWAGERDWHSLCEEIDRNSALLVSRVLEEMERPSHPAPSPVRGRGEDAHEVGLPAELRAALERGDQAEAQRIFSELSADEQAQVMAMLQQQITPEQLIAQLPADFREAMGRQDDEAAQRIFQALPEAEQQRVAAILQALQQMQGDDEEDDEDAEELSEEQAQALFAQLPAAIQVAIMQGDQAAVQVALAALPANEEARVVETLQALGME